MYSNFLYRSRSDLPRPQSGDLTFVFYSMRQIRGERIQKILIALDKISIWRRLEYKRP